MLIGSPLVEVDGNLRIWLEERQGIFECIFIQEHLLIGFGIHKAELVAILIQVLHFVLLEDGAVDTIL